MSLLEDFERAHRRRLHGAERSEKLPPSLKTPDGRDWRLSEIIVGWKPRISDRWAWSVLHGWIIAHKVLVAAMEMPCELSTQDANDPAREFVERMFGPGERDQPHIHVGMVDFAGEDALVEFGSITPASFVINLGTECCNHVVVPFSSRYAFIFSPQERLFSTTRNGPATPPRKKRTRP